MSITKSQLLSAVNEFNSRNDYSFTINQISKFVDEQFAQFQYCENEIELLENISVAFEYYSEIISANQTVDEDELDFSQYS